MKKISLITKFNLVISLVVLFFLSQIASAENNKEHTIKSLSIPGLNWSLDIDLTGFTIKDNNFGKEFDSRVIFGSNEQTGLVLSVYIEKAAKSGDHIACREYYNNKLKQSGQLPENSTEYERDGKAFFEYSIESNKGKTVNYRSINAFMAHKGYWIDIHISKVQFKENERKAFDNIFDNAKINTNKTSGFVELFLFSSMAFYAGKYNAATIGYELLLENGQKVTSTNKNLWYVFVDNLAMAYGITGDNANAKRTLAKGIEKDPEYPGFYYILACVFAETSDIEQAIENLEKAYSRKENCLENETLANPKDDPSFKKYLGNVKFVEFLEKHNLNE